MLASPDPDEVTQLLQAAHDGDGGALNRLLPLIYDELRKLARTMLADERVGHTLQPTALVHEAWLRLVRQDRVGFEHRAEFFSAAAMTMRRVLVDHARRRRTEKRGAGAAAEPLDETVAALERSCGDLLSLGEALDSLAVVDERKARLVELRFFAGLGMRESARVLSISERQAERDWTTARAWLRTKLAPLGDVG